MPLLRDTLTLLIAVQLLASCLLAAVIPDLARAISIGNKSSSAPKFTTPTSPLIWLRQTNEIPGYDPTPYVVLHQFENAKTEGEEATSLEAEYKARVFHSVITVMEMVYEAFRVVATQKLTQEFTDVSFLRYFYDDEVVNGIVYDVLYSILQALGAPPWNDPELRNDRECMPAYAQLHIYYLDPPDDKADIEHFEHRCSNGQAVGYKFPGKNGNPNGIALCDVWFKTWNVPRNLNQGLLADYLEFGYANPRDEPFYFSARVLLHGMS